MIEIGGDSYNDVARRVIQFRIELKLTNVDDHMFWKIKREFGKEIDNEVDILKMIIERGLKELDIEAMKDIYFQLNEAEISKEVEFTPSERGAGRKLFEERQDWIEAYDKMMSSAAKIIAIERERKE